MPTLLAAFSSRSGPIEVSLALATSKEMAAILQERLADGALGPRISGPAAAGLESHPLFRYHLVVVAAPGHRLAPGSGAGLPGYRVPVPAQAKLRLSLNRFAQEVWLVDPDATDPALPVHQILTRLHVPEDRIRVFPSQAAAWVAAEKGEGIAPAISHLVAAEPLPPARLRDDLELRLCGVRGAACSADRGSAFRPSVAAIHSIRQKW